MRIVSSIGLATRVASQILNRAVTAVSRLADSRGRNSVHVGPELFGLKLVQAPVQRGFELAGRFALACNYEFWNKTDWNHGCRSGDHCGEPLVGTPKPAQVR